MSTRAVVEDTTKQLKASKNKQRHPTSEEIAARAYELFLQRGASHGSDLQDWFQAEGELEQPN